MNFAYFSYLIICLSPHLRNAFLLVVLMMLSLPSSWDAFLPGTHLSVLSSPAVLLAAGGMNISGDLLPAPTDS